MEQFWSFFHEIRQFVFAMKLWKAALLIVLLPIIWALAHLRWRERTFRKLSTILLILFLFGIVLLTLLERGGGELRELALVPFSHLMEKGMVDEVVRSFLMNVLQFVPLGLFLPDVLPQTWRARRKLLITVLIGFTASIVIESLQYLSALGRTEIDDLIANTLGTGIGTLNVLIVAWLVPLIGESADKFS